MDSDAASARSRQEEFTAFFRVEHPSIVRTVHLILHDQERAKEIAQDAFIQAYSRWSRVSRYDRPGAWVRRIAIRMAMREARRQRLFQRALEKIERPRDAAPEDVDVMRAVLNLSVAQRAAVVLYYFEDRPVSEVADILGCSESTARVHLHNARKRLGAALGDVSDDD